MNTVIVSNVRKASRKEKHLKRAIINELQDAAREKEYLAQQAYLDKLDAEENLRNLEAQEDERRRAEDEEFDRRYFYFDWDDQLEQFY